MYINMFVYVHISYFCVKSFTFGHSYIYSYIYTYIYIRSDLGEEVAGGLAAAARLHAVPVEGVVPRLLGGGDVCQH